MSIRQVMMLADRNWINAFTYARALTPTDWKRYGSGFLAMAICIHVLGFIISPLQQILLSSKTIKKPPLGGRVEELFDIPYHLAYDPGYTNNTVVLATRNALGRTSVMQPQTQLWPPGNKFFSPAPFPKNCGDAPGSLYFHHKNVFHSSGSDDYSWAVIACMPADMRQSPWISMRDRQDFSEDLPGMIRNPEAIYLDSHKGPLQTLTRALFGPGCFFEAWPRLVFKHVRNTGFPNPDVCLSMAPLGGLFLNNEGSLDMRDPEEYPTRVQFPCGFNGAQTAEEAIYSWLKTFHQDMGKDTSIPTFSVGGIVTVSVLLGLYLFILMGLGYYSARTPRWTEQLDSFAMMGIGASVADDVPLLAGVSNYVAILDKIPGAMGNSAPGHERIGKLALGGSAKRLYASYKWSV
ncbi:hypothetical protein PENFLA_c019G09299 [Penicillium flavigenum]|uniref:Uncharacterized protein n=1 Tax=Penicillium flavigenum TaxID=254877 RepID=A0A1V6T040_9EURO|nr:hypothetical protein PENFLA_c019G09299 [Penicillium flavigenum]